MTSTVARPGRLAAGAQQKFLAVASLIVLLLSLVFVLALLHASRRVPESSA